MAAFIFSKTDGNGRALYIYPMRYLFNFLFFGTVLHAHAQTTLYDSVNYRHYKISKASLTVLSGWSAASLVSGLVGKNNTTGEQRYFYKRNVLWGSINLGLSGLGFLRSRREAAIAYSAVQTFKRTRSVQKTFLFNAGLDLAYVAFGLYTHERGGQYSGDKRDKLRGTGNSLILQGGFLTLFDAVLYLLHTKNGNRLDRKLEGLGFGATADGYGLSYRF